MSEDTARTGISATKSATDTRSYRDILNSLVGGPVTVVNPESYEGAPVGYSLRTGFYKAKATAMGSDHIVVVTEFTAAGRKVAAEPVKQYIPFDRIKRISVTKSERILHL